ncbi:PREDICTED: probable mitochondrial adenine nucleotide transporter BTL3 isoform X1 [Camelina sativa]|uniref:Probable mitochondrial adenine nucleotide transporter BTL3 isoform X1 n=1 Tax=Camelina sativa TaxID=90675 RepID=A0ABM0UQ97_CAMSA|nr:PREDICTED: probable mitochondrial adenine nucleotide transporter BTL3 isoform X1 [Camelina sativa]
MRGLDRWLADAVRSDSLDHNGQSLGGGLFLDESAPSSSVSFVSSKDCSVNSCRFIRKSSFFKFRRRNGTREPPLLCSVSLSINGEEEEGEGYNNGRNGYKSEKDSVLIGGCQKATEKLRVKGNGTGALNTTKHLWAGAFAASWSFCSYGFKFWWLIGFWFELSRTCIAPLERMKLEYIVRGEQGNLLQLIQRIATTEGIRGFWKGNLVNILRTAPFKSINFYAYDTYRGQLLKLSGNEGTTNFERFVAGAAAGVTASLLCLPLDTIRTVMVAPGGEALGGVVGAFRHMIQTEGFFSLYKGLVPSLVSMAPSGAVFYGVYDILKSAYLHTREGKKRLEHMKQEGEELNAFDQLELGPMRTLLYGAIAGACSEAATYPFEVVRRRLQMQSHAKKLSAVATCVKIIEQGGVPALYAGLIPSLLQVLPSAAISYFVYEFMKVVLKVESAQGNKQ